MQYLFNYGTGKEIAWKWRRILTEWKMPDSRQAKLDRGINAGEMGYNPEIFIELIFANEYLLSRYKYVTKTVITAFIYQRLYEIFTN